MGFQDFYKKFYTNTDTSTTPQGDWTYTPTLNEYYNPNTNGVETPPTIIYVTDPVLIARVAKLEEEISSIKEYLKGDDGR